MASKKRKAPSGSCDYPSVNNPPSSTPNVRDPGIGQRKGLDLAHLPLASITEMFDVMCAKALRSNREFARRLINEQPLEIVVATVCSGTEAPLTALKLIIGSAFNRYLRNVLRFRHQFSCEIEPYKQAFIRRNHDPPIIFRNVVELGAHGAQEAMDASGFLKPIPDEKLDLLVAGTSCVDFSTLNNRREGKTKVNAFKDYSMRDLNGEERSVVGLDPDFRDAVHNQLTPEGLESIGESMTTFLSTLSFIMDRRPRMVIIENVQTAPWKAMRNFWLPRAGYAAEYIKIDSKDFYVPQERIRGYLVAFDADEFNETDSGADAAVLVRRALRTVLLLKQRATSSALDFLLDEDDPNLLQARDEIGHYGAQGNSGGGRGSNASKQVDWDFNKLRHAVYAQRWNLDTIRRFSKANLGHGRVLSIRPPANSWIEYWARETPRVIDLFDNLYQQLLTRTGCDMNYKAAMFNISQSLDRMPVGIAKFGLAPIITPSGMPTLSNLARPLLGVECLTLQAIPNEHLRLAGETHKELRDLAGNAMTATVVGAVILASLMAASPHLAKLQRTLQRTEPVASSSYAEPLDFDLKELRDWNFGTFRLDAASVQAYGCFRVCHCPLVGAHNRATFRCRDCGKFACEVCKVNPPHNFEPYSHANRRFDIADLKAHLQQGLPGIFNMKMRDSIMGYFNSTKERGVNSLRRFAVKAILSNNEFYFSGIKVSAASVIVEYRSAQGIARLTMTRTGGADWYIFGSSSDALGTSRIGARRYRRAKPVAKGSLGVERSTVDPEAAVWFLWEPVKHSWLANVFTKEDHSFKLDHETIQCHSCPPPHLETLLRDTIRGTWKASPRCGTAGDGLYIRNDGPRTGQNSFLFKDVDPIGHPANDYYVFSRNIDLAESYDYDGTEVTLELIQMQDMGEEVRVSVPGYWQPIAPMVRVETSAHIPKQGDYFHHASRGTLMGNGEVTCCATAPLTLAKFSVDLADFPVSSTCKEKWTYAWYNVPAAELDEFLRAVLFANNALQKGQLFRPEEPMSRDDPNQGVPIQLCPDCCIEPPQLRWVKGNNAVVPWEHPKEVREYDARSRAMPAPFATLVRLDPDKGLLAIPGQEQEYEKKGRIGDPPRFKGGARPDYHHDLRVQLAVNPRTLASRAAANLVYGFRSRRYSEAIRNNVQCSYQVEVGTLLGLSIRFDRFYDSIPNTEDRTGLSDDEPSEELRVDCFAAKDFELYEDQTRSVKWMVARERSPAPYPEIESEERVFEAFNLRIVGRAVYLNNGSPALSCRGGVVAHQIGYGKTVVTIALLEHRRSFDKTLSLAKRSEAAARFWGSDLSFFHLKATLVIVPEHITQQWKAEFGKFGSNAEVIIIKRYTDLTATPLSVLEAADVIIVPTSLLKTTRYKTNLSSLMGDRPGGGQSDREVEDRYRTSLETIRKVVARYRKLPGNLSDAAKETRATNRAKEILDEINRAYHKMSEEWVSAGGRKEANKLQRQGLQKQDVKNTEGEKGKKPAKPKSLWTVTSFLENFSFARIIVDEFSYDNPEVTLFFSNALANAKWLLSGTPRCDNLADIVHLGRLLSVHVARPDPCIPTYLDPITYGPPIKPTAVSEEYRLRASHLRSHNFALDRHRTAETFIKHFMRQDKVDLSKFEWEAKKYVVKMPTLSRIAYGGLRHEISLANGDIFNLPFSLRRALDIANAYSFAGDSSVTGTKVADSLMARFAAVPISSRTLRALLGACDLNLITLKEEIKTAIDKLTWLCHRVSLVEEEIRNKYPRHHNIRTLIEDIFTAMADARDSWDKWPMAPHGGRDAFHHLTKAVSPASCFRYQEGGLEGWNAWKYCEAKSFWPDWYDLHHDYIDELVSPEKREELVELSTDAILLNISHPLGRCFAPTGDGSWLDSHAKVLGRVMDERTRANFLDARQASSAEQSRAAAVRDTVPKFSSEQLVKFLKDCMEEKQNAFEFEAAIEQKMAELGKKALQRHCLHRNLSFADSNGAPQLAENILQYVQGRCTKKDFFDKRGMISPRTEFPIPNETFKRRGGKTEATLEELTLTYSYLSNCREVWVEAVRRLRLYDFLRFVQRSQYEQGVEIYCDACLRRPVCTHNIPGFLLLACGHWLCEKHEGNLDEKGDLSFCPAPGCGAPCGLSHPTTIKLTERDVLDCPDVWDPEGEARCSEGGKIPGIVSLISQIPEDEKVILFTFVEELAVSVRDKLIQGGINVLSMVAAGPDAELAAILESFKDGKAKVIIIDPTAEHAAGSNLTIANHVIFASPILERDPFLRRMHYRQAVGRCLRQGQMKKVFVHTFVTEGTIDDELYDSEVLVDSA